MSYQNKEPHVLIIGAGITGLVLAQALKTHGIPFTVLERDPEPSTRGRGWGLTIHWALDTFLSLLPQSLIDRLPETYVDPVAVEKGEKANFLFFDLRSGESRWQVPAAKRMRVSRERLRTLMMEDIEIKVGEILILRFRYIFPHGNTCISSCMDTQNSFSGPTHSPISPSRRLMK